VNKDHHFFEIFGTEDTDSLVMKTRNNVYRS